MTLNIKNILQMNNLLYYLTYTYTLIKIINHYL